MVREAKKEDLDSLLELYLFLHEDCIPEKNMPENAWITRKESRCGKAVIR